MISSSFPPGRETDPAVAPKAQPRLATPLSDGPMPLLHPTHVFHQMLHGVDIRPPSSRFSKSIGHQHVLEPDLRTNKGAHNFAQHLLTKAAERLRRGDYYCRRLGLQYFLDCRSRRLVE
jgi:hypothetical protein